MARTGTSLTSTNALTNQQVTMLERVARVLSLIGSATGLPSGRNGEGTASRLSIEMIRVLLFVAANPMSQVNEIAQGTGQQLTTVSRQLLDLGIRNRRLEPGWGLVEPMSDAVDLRVKRYRLTDAGRDLIVRVLGEMR